MALSFNRRVGGDALDGLTDGLVAIVGDRGDVRMSEHRASLARQSGEIAVNRRQQHLYAAVQLVGSKELIQAHPNLAALDEAGETALFDAVLEDNPALKEPLGVEFDHFRIKRLGARNVFVELELDDSSHQRVLSDRDQIIDSVEEITGIEGRWLDDEDAEVTEAEGVFSLSVTAVYFASQSRLEACSRDLRGLMQEQIPFSAELGPVIPS